MAAKPPVSPFKFGFYAGLGFMCAQVVFGLLVLVVVLMLGLGTVFSLMGKQASAPAPLRNVDTSTPRR